MKLPSFHLGRPQQIAALLLLFFCAECAWIVSHQQLSVADYRFARCGREMWERPSPLAGYFTTCGNLQGDGTFAYRLAGLPLTIQRLVLLSADHLRSPEHQRYSASSLNGSTWEARHELTSLKLLIHGPFVLFAAWLGAGLWWVCRRLFGNEGGAFALGLYVLSPAVLRYSVTPNNDILAMWGLFGLIYTAIGVAHAMQGPPRKWRPRLILLTAALGLTAAAHILAALFGFVASFLLMFYLAVRRRSAVMQTLVFCALGALVVLFAFWGFRPAPFTYVFSGGSARFWFSTFALQQFSTSLSEAPLFLALGVSAILWLGSRRSRYFGNTAPLLVALPLLVLEPTQSVQYPILWALPFLITFASGVFADAFETRYRKLFLALSLAILLTAAVSTLSSLGAIARLTS